MANNVYHFYYAPTWDWPPEGPIKLGNVITSIKRPEQPLYTAPLPAMSEVFSSEKTEVEYSREKANSGGFSILTKFLSLLGVGVDVGADWETSQQELYTFERVDTTQFVPKEDYLQRCIEAEEVRRHLDRSRYRKPVYVITGVKTVYGAKAKSYVSQAYGAKLGVSVDGTLWSGSTVPALEPGIEGHREVKGGTSWEGSSSFVFAFRVRKVYVNRKTQTVGKSYDYNKGALLDDKKENIREDFPGLIISSEEDPRPEDEGYLEGEFMEADTVIACAFPKPEDEDV